MSDELSVSELGSRLYDCANVLRGSMDSGEYKDYILPLVFYAEINRRVKQQYEDKMEMMGLNDDHQTAKTDGGVSADLNTESPEFEIFRNTLRDHAEEELPGNINIPTDHGWESIRNKDDALAEEIDTAFEKFREENEDYSEPFAVRFNEGTTGPFSGADGDTMLSNVIQIIDESLYQIDHHIPYDLIGEVFMYLVKKFARQEGGEYFTPTQIVRLVVELLEPFEAKSHFYDPTSGSAGMLVEAARNIQRGYENGDQLYHDLYTPEDSDVHLHDILTHNDFKFSGQEKNPKTAGFGRMNLTMHDIPNTENYHGDSLSNTKFTKDGELETFDYILANFPFSVKWDKKTLKDDKYERFNWGDKLPHANRGDYAFIMHMYAHLNETGKMATIIPHGVLFRNSESQYREYMIENDILEAVIGLPEKLFEGTGIPSDILVVNKDKPENREGEVMFFNADIEDRFYRDTGSSRTELIDPISDEYQEADPADQPIYRNMANPTGIAEIKQMYDAWDSEERVTRVVSNDEIRENDYNMNIALYVDTTEPQPDISVTDTLSTINDIETEYQDLNQQLQQYMQQLDYTTGDTK